MKKFLILSASILTIILISYFQQEKKSNDNLSGLSSRPSEYSTTLAEGKTEAHSDTTLKVNSITLQDDTSLDSSVLGNVIVLKIAPGRSNSEIVKCSGLTAATKTFTGCTFGLAFNGTNTSASSRIKAHSPGETVILSNDDLYLSTVYPQANASSTIQGIWQFSSSTSPNMLSIGHNDNSYDKRITVCTGTYPDCEYGVAPWIGYSATSSKWFVSNNGVNYYDPITGGGDLAAESAIVIQGSVIKLATSTASGLIYSSGLQINPGYGLAALTSDNQLKIATSTAVDWTFGGNVQMNKFATSTRLVVGNLQPTGSIASTTAGLIVTSNFFNQGNATSTGSMSVSTLCFGGTDCTNMAGIIATSSAALLTNTANSTTTMATYSLPAANMKPGNVMWVSFSGKNDASMAGSGNISLNFNGTDIAICNNNANDGTTFLDARLIFGRNNEFTLIGGCIENYGVLQPVTSETWNYSTSTLNFTSETKNLKIQATTHNAGDTINISGYSIIKF